MVDSTTIKPQETNQDDDDGYWAPPVIPKASDPHAAEIIILYCFCTVLIAIAIVVIKLHSSGYFGRQEQCAPEKAAISKTQQANDKNIPEIPIWVKY